MARIFEGNHLCLLLFSLLFAGSTVEALSYDYFASIECLEDPLEPQYGGGILVNPEFNQGLKGWSSFGRGKIETGKSSGGNNFVVAHTRKQPFDSFSQKIYMEKEKLYTFSAWIQVNKGKESVAAVFKTSSEITHAGAVVAEAGCWSMLKGGLTVDSSGFVELYFESNNTSVEIWLDSVSLQPFTKKEWKSHQIQSIEKVRKRNVSIHVADASGKILDGATIHVKQNKPGFPFGSAISKAILDNTAYQNWFTPRFTVTTFENEMKWYVTEYNPGRVNYTLPDAMVQFVKQHGISIRGHNIFWDNPKYQPYWVKTLQPDQLKAAAERRINSVIPKYKGQVIAWDVMNENLHFSYFEDRLGKNASSVFYQQAYQLDPNTVMFMNEYNTLEYTKDSQANPAKYLEKLREIKAFSGNHGPIGIGLQGHFQTPNIPYVRASLDTLASVNLPIWLTELDVNKSPKQTQYLDEVLREVHSHPAVQGIVLWTIWHADGCRVLCLTDDNFKNLPAGDLVDKLINEWKQQSFTGTTDSNGEFETRLFHGDYDVIITHPSMNSTTSNRFKVSTATESSEESILHLQVNV